MKKRIIAGGIVVIALCAMVLPKILNKKQFADPVADPVVEITTPGRGDIRLTSSLIGQVEPEEVVYVYPKASGDVTEVPIKAGEQVEAGQLLCVIDTRQIESAKSNLDSAQLALRQAKEELGRQSILYAAGGISEQAGASRAKREARDSGDMETYGANASYEAIYKNAIKSYNKMIEGLDKYSSNKGQITLEKQLTRAAQSLMISYQSLLLQKKYLSRMEELLRTQYEHTALQQSVGLATDQEVHTAYNNWSDARISLDSLEAGEISVYQNLCLLLGVDETGTMEIQKIPSADLQTIAEINLEEDTKKAIGNNLDISSTRNTESGGTAGIEKKRRTLAELEETLSVKMKELYDRIQQAKTARDAAQTGYQNAQTAWNLAQSKYQMGMLDKTAYLTEEMQYIQKKAGLESADLELLQALEDYQWAVRGIVSLE